MWIFFGISSIINNGVYKNIVKYFAKLSTVVERIVCIL